MSPVIDFANDNAGLWALLALPFAIAPAIELAMKIVTRLRTAARDDDLNLRLMRKQLRRRIELDISQRLVLDTLLEARLRSPGDAGEVTTAGLYDAVDGGIPALVVGGAGSGKSMLALALVEHSLERVAVDPESPLMEAISLRDWRPSSRQHEWKHLLNWMAGRLDRSYPLFGEAFFRKLLKEQKLIACLDGLDEMSVDARKEAVRALGSYAASGLPLVVLSRDPEAVSGQAEDGAEGLPPRFERFDLLAPSDSSLAKLPDWADWERFVADARQPHRAAALIGNPLRLSVAALTWSRAERPEALAAADDVEAELWGSFFARKLGPLSEDKDPGSLRQLAGWIAVAATQRTSSTFRVVDLYTSAKAIKLACAISALPVLALAWHRNIVGIGILGAMSLLGGMSTSAPRLEGFVSRLGRHRGENSKVAMFMGLVGLMAIATVAAGNLFESFVTTPLQTSSGVVALWSHPFEGRALASWWETNGIDVLFESFFLAGIFSSLFLFTAVSDLRFRDGLAVSLTDSSTWVILTAGLFMIVFGFEAAPVYFLFIVAVLLVCWSCAALGRVLLTSARHLPPAGLQDACRKLVQIGILTGSEGVYRFRHDEISSKLGAEKLDQLARSGELGMLPEPAAVSKLVDSRIDPAALERADRLTAGLAEIARSDQLAITNRTLYLYLGAFRPEDALPGLKAFLHRYPDSIVRVHLGELLDALGRSGEADPIWSGLLEEFPEADWIVNKWVRRQSVRGEAAAASDLLRRADTAKNAFRHLLLVELAARFGDDDDLALAIESLERMRRAGDPYLVHRSTLELARLRAEVLGECEEAEALLRTILDEGLMDSLKYARFAQLRHVAGDGREAEQFARESSSLLCWDADPTFQLESLLTQSRVCGDSAAATRAKALMRFGWSLPGRESGRLIRGRFDYLLLGDLSPSGNLDPA